MSRVLYEVLGLIGELTECYAAGCGPLLCVEPV